MEAYQGMVFTTLGEVPQSDLRIEVKPAEETADVWVYARECYYQGKEFPDKVGELVRRDVWVTMKTGQKSQAQSNL